MNCQEPPEPECHCCEECIQLQKERFRRNYYQEEYQKPPSPPNWRNDNCCESEGYPPRSEKRSSEHYKSSSQRQNCCDQKQWVDANTLKTLSSLRERACKFLETSEGTRSGDEDECRPYTRVKESHPCDSPTRKKAQNINYEPESQFLRKMKQKSDIRMTEPDSCPPPPCKCRSYPQEVQQPYLPEVPYSGCVRSANEYTRRPQTQGRQYVSEQATQYSDTSSIHDPCTCYRTWRPKSREEECPEEEVDLMKEYNELCRELSEFQETLETGNDVCDENEDDDEVEIERGPCERKSRGQKKTKRGSRTRAKPCQESENDFQPSLKKPHPNSCERCWRYASPSRSPVNKPSQRFDPNYRKSHSDVCLNAEGKEKGVKTATSRESKLNSMDERETKVHQLMSPGSRISSPIGRSSFASAGPPGATKSNEDLKSRRGSKADQSRGGTSYKSAKDGILTGTGGGGAKSRTDSTNMTKSPSRGDGRSLSVNFEDKVRKKGGGGIQSSPSMLDKKLEKKEGGGGGRGRGRGGSSGRPSTSEFGSGTKIRKDSKSKTGYASQASTCEVKPVKPRSLSSDRERSPCGKTETRAASPCLKQSAAKPSDFKHQSDCPYKRTSYDSGRSRPETPGSKTLRQENTRQTCPRHGSDSASRREITSSAHRCGNCQFCRSNSPSRSSRDGGVRPSGSAEGKKCGCRGSRSSQDRGREQRSGSSERQNNNPRKYCVFYMNKTKLNRADDVEVLIEELTQGKSSKDSGDEDVRDKVKRGMKDVRGESMALRFQKGVNQNCQRPENNRVLYF